MAERNAPRPRLATPPVSSPRKRGSSLRMRFGHFCLAAGRRGTPQSRRAVLDPRFRGDDSRASCGASRRSYGCREEVAVSTAVHGHASVGSYLILNRWRSATLLPRHVSRCHPRESGDPVYARASAIFGLAAGRRGTPQSRRGVLDPRFRGDDTGGSCGASRPGRRAIVLPAC